MLYAFSPPSSSERLGPSVNGAASRHYMSRWELKLGSAGVAGGNSSSVPQSLLVLGLYVVGLFIFCLCFVWTVLYLCAGVVGWNQNLDLVLEPLYLPFSARCATTGAGVQYVMNFTIHQPWGSWRRLHLRQALWTSAMSAPVQEDTG